MRQPYQVLVIPFVRKNDDIEYAVLKRSCGMWQGIAGGGESGETILETAVRETWEETGISDNAKFIELDSKASIPVANVVGSFKWGKDIFVIPEYCFGVEVLGKKIVLSNEHVEYRWGKYEDVYPLLTWESNKTALWELNERLKRT